MNDNKRKLAIFDVDGTIFRSSLLVELVHELVRRGIFPQEAHFEMEDVYAAWMNRRGSYRDYIKQLVITRDRYLKGCKFSDIDAVAKDVVSSQKDIVYRFTRAMVNELKEKNYFLLAISGSPIFMVEKFTAHFGFDAMYGNIFELKNGKFTGRVIKEAAHSKDNILQKFLEEQEKEKIFFDMARSIAVGDTEGDISILQLVGNPIAFNPNKVLLEYAKEKKWRIVIERKDVIYGLKDFIFI